MANRRNDPNMSRVKRHQGKNKKIKNKKNSSGFRRLLRAFLLLIGALFLIGFVLFAYYAATAPKLSEKKLEAAVASKIYDAGGNLLDELGSEKRTLLKASEIPQTLNDAVVSVEDKRFYRHIGVDPIRIVGSLVGNVKSGAITGGGSTLTQQLIKLSYFSTKASDQTLKRKAQEAWLALKLERRASKQEILTYYLNKVYMSNGIYGFETASETYYGKKLSELSLAQTAMLAGLPNAPSAFDPYDHPEACKQRRDIVLQAMLENKKISQTQHDEAVNTPINEGLQPKQTLKENNELVYDNYLTEVIKEVKKKTGKDPFTDGLSIYTNMDDGAQKKLYEIANSGAAVGFSDDEMQTAATLIDPNSGAVLAQIGRRNQKVQFADNLAVTAKRDVGSTIKPLIDYGPAIEYLRWPTAKILLDEPYDFPGTNTAVHDYDNSYRGALTMREALVDSRNIPAVKTLQAVGLDKSAAYLKKMGITFKDGVQAANAISASISSLQLAAAYAVYANGGTYYEPTYVNKVVEQDGQVHEYSSDGKKVAQASTAYMVTDMLKDVIRRGTGQNAAISGLPQAGKTGTSNYLEADLSKVKGDANGYPDITFVGYTPDFTLSVWTGYEDYFHAVSENDTMIASTIYRELMQYVTNNHENKDWKMPDNVYRSGGELYLSNGKTTTKQTEKASTNQSISSTQSMTSSSLPQSSSEPASTSFSSETSATEPSTSAQSSETAPSSSTAPAPAPTPSSSVQQSPAYSGSGN